MAGITIYVHFSRFLQVLTCRASLLFSPSLSSGRLYYIKHIRQLSIIFISIIGKNSDFFRFGNLHKNRELFYINCTNKEIGARHRHISEHIFDNSLSIIAYRYSDIDRFILIKSYRYNYIDTGLPIRGV